MCRRVEFDPLYFDVIVRRYEAARRRRALKYARQSLHQGTPGPNNPVGLVWIDLTEPTYGIHGTPGPSDIGKTQSHGCIRLTNWDAVALAGMVRPGDVVRFEDQDSPIAPSAESAPVSETQRPELNPRGP